MRTADGLLVRLRPDAAGFSPDGLAALAEAAGTHGNGLLEVTARGSLQVRGLSPDTVDPFRAALAAARVGIAPDFWPERSPLAGLDPEERADPRALLSAFDSLLAARTAPVAPKLSLVVESGGRFGLGALAADIAFRAAPGGWSVSLAGAPLGVAAEDDCPSLLALLLDAIGSGRARDLDRGALRLPPLAPPVPSEPVAHPVAGIVPLAGTGAALLAAPAFGQVEADALAGFGRAVAAAGGSSIRPCPHRLLAVTGLSAATAGALAETAAALGFVTRPGGEKLTLCSGAERVGGRVLHVAQCACLLTRAAPFLGDGSLHLHASTCAKGCAHPGRDGLRLMGDRIVSHGHPETTLALLDGEGIETAIATLARRLARLKGPGETALDALARAVRDEEP